MQPKRFIVILWIAVLLGPLLASLHARADVYKWVDANGVTHYSDKPPQAGGHPIKIESRPDAPPSTYQPPADSKVSPEPDQGSQSRQPEPVAKTKTPPKVDLYITSWCKYCKKAQAFFLKNNIPFQAYDIEKDAAAAKRRRAIDARSGVPLAVINGKVILGFSESAYRHALGIAP